MPYQTDKNYKLQCALTLEKGDKGVSAWYVHTEDSSTKAGTKLVIRKVTNSDSFNSSYKFKLKAADGENDAYKIKHVASECYVAPHDGSVSASEKICVEEMDNESAVWSFTNPFTDENGDTWYWVSNKHSGMCMKVKDNDNEDGTRLQQENGRNGANTASGKDINYGFYFRLINW
ncbi:MAG: RICIN domain-containing protein [Bacteroidia bacterium]|nr:RICIN domain-containing protein [Bacteroidia bacterium]